MLIDALTYCLPEANYSPTETKKNQIVLGNTFNVDMRHFIGWKNRLNGYYAKTAHYTISRDGRVYQHFKPSYYSKYFEDIRISMNSIVILLENEGWLGVDAETNEFLTWFGDIYKTTDNAINKQWRNHYHWAPYTKSQFESTVDLVKKLCYDFNIPINVSESNIKCDDPEDLGTIIYKSNLSGAYTDLSPAWDFSLFKDKMEIKQTNNETIE